MGNIFGGGGKKKDPAIPAPRTDNTGMLIKLHHGTGDPEPREVEALQVLQAYVSAPWFPIDREITLRAVSWEDGRKFFMSRGNPSSGWPKTRTGYAYAPRPDLGHAPQIHFVINNLSKEERIKLALHEWGHLGVYHYLLSYKPEWGQIDVWGSAYPPGPYELFADQFCDMCLGAKLRPEFRDWFPKVKARLEAEGQAAIRG